jgi:thiamine biosynthesis lipoprotein
VSACVVRRARPALGTLVEMGVRGTTADEARPRSALAEAFRALAEVERALSAFDASSDIGRFNDAAAGDFVPCSAHTTTVLTAARELERDSSGLFDVTQGTGPKDWSLATGGICKHGAAVRIDLGGIGKGHAVDRALDVLRAALPPDAGAWVNAGGDMRVAGLELPVMLRDEERGGVRPWMVLRQGALATSWFGAGARSRLSGAVRGRHVSVTSPLCLHSDALTKVVALSGRIDHPLLARHGATAWIHP